MTLAILLHVGILTVAVLMTALLVHYAFRRRDEHGVGGFLGSLLAVTNWRY